MCQIRCSRAVLAMLALAAVLAVPRRGAGEEQARAPVSYAACAARAASTSLCLAPEDAASAQPAFSPERGQAGGWQRACSFRNALCVVAAAGTEERVTLATLDAADRAWETLTRTLGVPAPRGAWGSAWRLFLVDGRVDGIDGAGTARATSRDPVTAFDAATSIGLVDRRTRPGCALDVAVARAIARASLWEAAPATDEGSAVAETESLARLASACSTGAEDAEVFQAHPERTVVDPSDPAFDRGASAFFDWLDATFATEPGAIVPAMWALAPTRSPAAASAWAEKPTGFDVLRVSLKGALWADSTIDDALVRFAVHRTNLDPPPRAAWALPWPTSPRRIAPAEPTSPTGASYVAIDAAGAPPGAKLRLIASWEDFGRMRWVVLKLGPSGVRAELDVTSPDKATRAAMVVEGLRDVERLLIIGVGLGSTEHPFDPGQGSWVAHGWILTLESE